MKLTARHRGTTRQPPAAPTGPPAMRPLAFLLAAFAITSVVAQEPRRNPFRDGTGKASPVPAKPDVIKEAPKVLRAADAGVGVLVPDVAFTDLTGKPGKL